MKVLSEKQQQSIERGKAFLTCFNAAIAEDVRKRVDATGVDNAF